MSKVRAASLPSVGLALVGLALLVSVVVAVPVSSAAEDDPGRRADRVVIITIPTLTWDLVADEDPPALTGFFSGAAVASASVRTVGVDTSLGEGYGTLGAGNRTAILEDVAGLAFGAGVEVDGERADEVLARRSGNPLSDAAVVHLGAPALANLNDRLLFGAEPGALGHALTAAGMTTAVVANGALRTEVDPDIEAGEVRGEAALVAMDRGGRIAAGSVGPELLRQDPDAPFGARLDPGAVLDAFDGAADASLLVVELSDLRRADAFRALAAPEVARVARERALADTDELLAALLDRVDTARDLVLLVAPTPPLGPSQLVVAAMAGPAVEPGLAQSGTTSRPGYVTLPDFAPTALTALGLEVPGTMNGAPMSASGGGDPGPGTARSLAEDNVRALFRNAASGPLTVVFIILVVVSLALAALALAGRAPRARGIAAYLQLVALATPLVTYLAGLVREDRLGVSGSIVAILLVAGGLAGIARLLGRLVGSGDLTVRAFVPPLVLLGATAALLLVDVFVGAPLQIDTAFGYGGGPIVAGRFTGYGNLAGGLLTLSVIATSLGVWGLRQHLRGTREGPSRVAVAAIAASFAFTVAVTGLPGLGRDVGGVLALVPGFFVVLALLTGLRLSWLRVGLVGVGTVVSLGVFGVVDLMRPPTQRGHLGRLIDKTLGDEGAAGLLVVIERKLNANLSILTSSVWSVVIPVAVAFLAFLIWRPPRTMSRLLLLPGMRAFLIGSLVTCALVAVLNDSGIAIPGIMLTLLLPYVAHLALELPDGTVVEPSPRS